jgi:predicted transcriptional regulator YdeE
MKVEIITTPFMLDIYGISGIALNKNYTETAFALSGKMWEIIKKKKIGNKGVNIWVYESNESLFAGVELDHSPEYGTGLEQKIIHLPKYVYFKHIGPYDLIKQVGLNMKNELRGKGYETGLPYIEIYGHWTNDETKSETELLLSLV